MAFLIDLAKMITKAIDDLNGTTGDFPENCGSQNTISHLMAQSKTVIIHKKHVSYVGPSADDERICPAAEDKMPVYWLKNEKCYSGTVATLPNK